MQTTCKPVVLTLPIDNHMKRLLIAILIMATGTVFAQQELGLYNMRYLQQSGFTNPSFFHECNVNIGTPGISSIAFRNSNTGFVLTDLMELGSDDSITLTPDKVLDAMADLNYFENELRYDPIHFGFRVNRNYFGFNISVRNQFRLSYPRDFFTLLLKGNGSPELLGGEGANLDGLGLDLSTFTEIGFRYARKFGALEQLSIGIRPKLLLGAFNVHSRRSEISLQTDENTFDLTGRATFELNTASVVNPDPILDAIRDTGDIDIAAGDIFSFNNIGFGVDFGATYDMNEKIQFSGAVTDLGFIRWKSNTKTFEYEDKEFTFNGLNSFEDLLLDSDGADLGDTASSYFEDLLDSLGNEFAATETEDPYTTWLTARINLGANYQLAEKHNVGILVNSHFVKRKLRSAMTLSYGFRIRKWLGLHANYSIYNRSFNNIGVGFSGNIFPFQFYILTDNVLGVPFYENSKNTHLRWGINWTIGCKKKDRDGDGIPDKDDDCPKEAGPTELKGCPDTDGDGIIDNDDKCPTEKGPKEFEGCPDRDGDGIIDNDDACPDEPGIEAFAGCPDTDEDGIQDAEDECPEEAGIATFNGCPDTDEDGIKDSEDDCPETPGIPAFNGCPDTDGDGIKDSEDACPEKPGDAAFQGCPDTDGDGLADNVDGCPETPGPVDNNGCPFGDRDGDGVIDKDDSCPDTFGPAENAGCPYSDLDGDGVFDKDDRCPQTPGPAENAGCPEIEEEEQEVINTAFDNLEFETGGDVIKQSSYESLDGLAELLVRKENWKIMISGHTDAVGSESANLKLSEKRSKSVSNYLESKGVPRERLIVKWYGESKPIATNDTPEGRQRNRRVEMEIVFD